MDLFFFYFNLVDSEKEKVRQARTDLGQFKIQSFQVLCCFLAVMYINTQVSRKQENCKYYFKYHGYHKPQVCNLKL